MHERSQCTLPHIPAGALKEGQLEVVSQLSEQYCSHTSRTIFISKFILLCYFLLRFWTVIAEGRLAFLCYTHKTSEGGRNFKWR